jgi:hypothetical protein
MADLCTLKTQDSSETPEAEQGPASEAGAANMALSRRPRPIRSLSRGCGRVSKLLPSTRRLPSRTVHGAGGGPLAFRLMPATCPDVGPLRRVSPSTRGCSACWILNNPWGSEKSISCSGTSDPVLGVRSAYETDELLLNRGRSPGPEIWVRNLIPRMVVGPARKR